MIERYVTHDGPPHLDDILAFATLELSHRLNGDELELIRSRNPEKFVDAQWVVDVGGVFDESRGRLDHHQFKPDDSERPRRENSVAYASAGMTWKVGGALCIDRVCARSGLRITEDQKREIFLRIDEDLYQPVDSHDNGELHSTNTHRDLGNETELSLPNVYLADLVRDYNVAISLDHNYDQVFIELAHTLERMVHARILRYADEIVCRSLLASAERLEGGAVIIFTEPVPSSLSAILHEAPPEVKFAIFPSNDSNDWTIRAIPASKGSFEFRVGFPADWRGLMANALEEKMTLREHLKMPGAIFCHAGGFIAKADDVETAKMMASRACA